MIIYHLATKGWSKLIWGSHSCVHSPNSAKCFLGARQCARLWWHEGEQTDRLCLQDTYSSTGQRKKSQIISPLQTTINAVKEDYTEDHHRVNWMTFREGMNGAAGRLGGGGYVPWQGLSIRGGGGLWWKKQRQKQLWGFPGGAVVKNLPANAGDMGSSPGLGRSHMSQSN